MTDFEDVRRSMDKTQQRTFQPKTLDDYLNADQQDLFFSLLDSVVNGNGHGTITLDVRNHHIRFLRRETNLDLMNPAGWGQAA
jgi:hypothetical protein